MKKLSVCMFIAFALMRGQAQEVTKVGTTAAKFLSIPVGSRALAMGGAFVAEASDASGMYWNPAGIGRLFQSEAVFAHAEWIADINFNYGGIIVPVEGLGTVGVSFTSMTTDEMERTTITDPEGTGEMFSVGSFALGVSYARQLTEWFTLGVSTKYVNEHIWNSSATGFAVDIGTLFTTPFPGLTFGAGISNFGTKLSMGGDDLIVLQDVSPNHGNNANINARLSTDDFDLPLTLRIGFSYDPLVDDFQQLTLVLDALHPNDNSESICAGAEYRLFHKIVALRGGYKSLGAKDSEEQFTLGAGVQYEVSAGVTAKVDYAYLKFGLLSNVHTFTIGILF